MSSLLKSRVFILAAGLAAIALIALADRALANGIPLALLYLAPIVPMSTVLRRAQILALGALCTVVAELSDAYPWTVNQGIPRDALYFFAYTAAGLYVSEVVSRRRVEVNHVAALETEIDARRGIEEQLRLVVANSSIAIVTADEWGTILDANEAAERLFAIDQTSPLAGTPLGDLMPSLARVQIRKEGWEHLRTMMQCQAFRGGPNRDREPFHADVWFSSYMTSGGGRLTAMIVDSSLEMRDREEANLEQVLVGSRLAIGAVSHEIRNICAAIAVVQQNLSQPSTTNPPEDLLALRQLVGALERIASVELSLVKRQAAKLRLDPFLRDLYIIVHPSLREAGVALHWDIAPNLPDVWADQQSLLQVFLNLVRNAETALAATPAARLSLCACARPSGVHITLSDNGPGVAHPERLFQPFRPSAGAQSGLGLYLSRAMMLSFHGDLRHIPAPTGARFVVEMAAAEVDA